MKPSRRRDQVFRFVRQFIMEHHNSPTIREIAHGVHLASTSDIPRYLKQLQLAGLLKLEKGKARAIWLTEQGARPLSSSVIWIPVIGRIVAGEPVLVPDAGMSGYQADGEAVGLARDLVLTSDTESLYALHVQGDSMVDASVHDGDTVVIKPVRQPQNGDLVAAWFKDEERTTLKRFYYSGSGEVELRPANPKYATIRVRPENLLIQGKVVVIIRQFAG